MERARLVPEYLHPSPSFAIPCCVILGESLNLWDRGLSSLTCQVQTSFIQLTS